MSKWSGRRVTRARAEVTARGFPQPCTRCGRPVYEDQRWQADHWPITRSQAKVLGIPIDQLEVHAAHGYCNESAGGIDGARKTNARRAHARRYAPAGKMESEASRNIRGV